MAQDGQRLPLGPGEAARLEGTCHGSTGLLVDRLGGRQKLLVGRHKHRDVAREGLRKGQKFNFHSIPSQFALDPSPLRRYGASRDLRPIRDKFGVASQPLRQYQYRPSIRE